MNRRGARARKVNPVKRRAIREVHVHAKARRMPKVAPGCAHGCGVAEGQCAVFVVRKPVGARAHDLGCALEHTFKAVGMGNLTRHLPARHKGQNGLWTSDWLGRHRRLLVDPVAP